jgi:hypothetical protein
MSPENKDPPQQTNDTGYSPTKTKDRLKNNAKERGEQSSQHQRHAD